MDTLKQVSAILADFAASNGFAVLNTDISDAPSVVKSTYVNMVGSVNNLAQQAASNLRPAALLQSAQRELCPSALFPELTM